MHKLRIYDSRLQWTTHNRDVCFAIFDGYQKAMALKNNLSASAIRQINTDKSTNNKVGFDIYYNVPGCFISCVIDISKI